MKDLKNRVLVAHLLGAGAVTTTTKSKYVDLADCNSALFLVNIGAGTFTGGSVTPKLQESDSVTDLSFTDVATDDLIGSFTAVTSTTNDGLTEAVGYIGSKRYVRVVLTAAGTVSVPVSVNAILGDLNVEPGTTVVTGTAS
ncbi:MAG TPA: hypothetical protein PKN66_08600 [Thermodesulfovibrio thiophilus]|nr:hypothetical protein [Thermodesulfovibrio thiophilus]